MNKEGLLRGTKQTQTPTASSRPPAQSHIPAPADDVARIRRRLGRRRARRARRRRRGGAQPALRLQRQGRLQQRPHADVVQVVRGAPRGRDARDRGGAPRGARGRAARRARAEGPLRVARQPRAAHAAQRHHRCACCSGCRRCACCAVPAALCVLCCACCAACCVLLLLSRCMCVLKGNKGASFPLLTLPSLDTTTTTTAPQT